MPAILSPQELSALESLSSLSLCCASCQLPDASFTSGWHSLRRLNFSYTEGKLPWSKQSCLHRTAAPGVPGVLPQSSDSPILGSWQA